MDVDEAASATLAFKPLVVTPYHYRNEDKSLSNLTEYKLLVVRTSPYYAFAPVVSPARCPLALCRLSRPSLIAYLVVFVFGGGLALL